MRKCGEKTKQTIVVLEISVNVEIMILIVIIIRLLITERRIIKNNGCSNSNNYNINDLKDEQNDRLEMKETQTWTRKWFGKYTKKHIFFMVISNTQKTI